MSSQSVLIADEVKSMKTEGVLPSPAVLAEGPDMTPGALKAIIVSLILATFYLAVCGAWLWSALYRYQNCL